MCLSKVSETDKWRLVQPERLRRLRLWASPARMFEVAEEGCRRCPPQRLDPRMSSEKSPRAMLLRACLSWRHDTATPRHEHQVFEGKGSLECGHVGGPRACRIAYKPHAVAYPDVRADRSANHLPGPDHTTGCEASMVYLARLEIADGRTVHPEAFEKV